MKFRDRIIEDIVTPQSKSKLNNAIGEIITYDKYNNVADVYVSNVKDAQGVTLEQVPIQLSGKGIHSSELKPSDFVYIQFNNGSIFQPKIIGICDEVYSQNTRQKQRHLRKGSLLVSVDKEDRELSTNNSKTWIDQSNNDILKYYDYKDLDPISDLSEVIEDIGYFNGREIGIYHPTKSSVVKIKDDGSVDIFTSTNTGIRIDASKKRIETFGDSYTKSDNWSVISNIVRVVANKEIELESDTISIKAKNFILNGEKKNGI